MGVSGFLRILIGSGCLACVSIKTCVKSPSAKLCVQTRLFAHSPALGSALMFLSCDSHFNLLCVPKLAISRSHFEKFPIPALFYYVPPPPPPVGWGGGGWGGHIIFAFFWRPPSVVTLGFLSFQGKVFILSLPNLVWVFIG